MPTYPAPLVDVKVENICTDNIDNDGDGMIDNQDGDCWIREGIIYRTHPVFYPNHSFKEITGQISSLKDLGIKTVLLAPFWKSPQGVGPATMSYHPLSYYELNPEYGTWDNLKELIETIHKNDMKVMLDLVTGVAEPGSDWYDYGTFKVPLEDMKKKYDLEYMEKGGYRLAFYNRHKSKISEITGEDFYDIIGVIDQDNNVVLGAYPNPKVGVATDRKNLKVIEYFEGVVTYYIKEYNVDGFRIDMPSDVWNKLLFPEDHTIYKMLARLKAAAIKEKPSVIFQAENVKQSEYGPEDMTEQTCEISGEVTLLQYYAFLPAAFEDSEKFVVSVKKVIDFPFSDNNPYKRSRRWQLENLNTPRVNVQFELAKISPNTLKPLIVMMTTLPGTPKIVAGQEIGETQDGGTWGTGNSEFFTTNPEVDWLKGNYELKNFYKKVFAVRNSHPALKYGGAESIKNVWRSGDNVYAYSRTYENENVIMVINFQNKAATSVLNLPFKAGAILNDELTGETFMVTDPINFRISVSAYGSRILTVKR